MDCVHRPQFALIASPLHRDPRRASSISRKSVDSQFEGGGSDVLLRAMPFRGARDRDNPGLLRDQPGERDPGRRAHFDPAEQSHQGPVGRFFGPAFSG